MRCMPASRKPMQPTARWPRWCTTLACRESLRNGSRTFLAASLLLPRAVREPACALYAFCRMADDEVDGDAGHADAVGELRRRLGRIYHGEPLPVASDRALASVIRRFAIPREVPEALLDGFEWDAEGRRYETIEELHAYAARVAGTVGAMMTLVMEVRDAQSLARACELGVAMQLTNIARDVGEDARNGRLYLPRAWMREAGLDADAWLAAPLFDARLASVIARLLNEASRLYARAECGVIGLPRDCRPAIQAARLVYGEIGNALEATGLNSVQRRTVVSTGRTLVLLLRATGALVKGPGHPIDAGAASAPLPAVQFLVEAATSSELPQRTFYQRTLRMIALFERQAERHRLPVTA